MATTNTTTNTTASVTGVSAGAGTSTTSSSVPNVPLSNTQPLPPMRYVGSSTVTPLLQLDKISSTAHNYSVVCSDNLFNGNVVEIGAITSLSSNDAYSMFDDGEVFQASKVSSSSDLVGLIAYDEVCPVEFIPDDARYVEAGKVARAYILSVGDVITVTNSGIAGVTPTVGTYIVPNGYDLTVSSTKPSTGLVLKCVGSDTLNLYPASVLMVVQV